MDADLVVKVGGSLYDLPDLGARLRIWLDGQSSRVLLVPGGGPAADWVRDVDARERLGEEKAHWLALRALGFAAHVLAARLPGSLVLENLADCDQVWRRGQVPILDMHAFASADEQRPCRLEHSWAVTSDSLAVRLAIVAGVVRVVLLKSRSISEPVDWQAASQEGIVDAAFPAVLASAPRLLAVSAINFRDWQAAPAAVSSATTPPPSSP